MTNPIYPVILSGGSGTRLWPMSRRLLPKQFLPLVSERSMLQDTLLRLTGLAGAMAPIVVSNNEHRFLVAEQLREIDLTPNAQILEPVGRNTAPAVAAAAMHVTASDPSGLLLVLPADHLIRDVPAFHAAVGQAAKIAASGSLVTFGIRPAEPATGYGYIERGEPLAGTSGGYRVARFVEKPDRDTAARFLESGRFSWNSGMFVLGARAYLDELGRFRPDILDATRRAWEKRAADLDFLRLDAEAFAACPSGLDRLRGHGKDGPRGGSADRHRLERRRLVDHAVGGRAPRTATAMSPAVTCTSEDAHDCYVRAESRMVSVFGLKNAIVVETDDAVLVADQSRAQAVKDIVGHLDDAKRSEHVAHSRVYRPWGWYESVDGGDRFQVKRIMVKPGAALSLQMHHHRAEHWVVVAGTARVTCNDDVKLLAENESTYIPIGAKHRLENPGKLPLHLIEVQSGGYLGEDDIVRFEDRYRRS